MAFLVYAKYHGLPIKFGLQAKSVYIFSADPMETMPVVIRFCSFSNNCLRGVLIINQQWHLHGVRRGGDRTSVLTRQNV